MVAYIQTLKHNSSRPRWGNSSLRCKPDSVLRTSNARTNSETSTMTKQQQQKEKGAVLN